MRYVQYFATALAIVMGGAILYGFVAGDFSDEGSALLDLPWGHVTLVDLYAGVVLVAGWMLYREGLTPVTAAWIVAFALTGNFATSLYVALAAHRAGDDHLWFWMGKRARLEVSRRS